MTDIQVHVDDSTYKKFESEIIRQNVLFEDAFTDAMNRWLSKNDLEKEKAINNNAYKRMERELKEKHFGKYAVIVQGKLTGVCDSLKEAWKIAKTGVARHYLILKVGDENKMARIRGSAMKIK